jgi:hypothetical protein
VAAEKIKRKRRGTKIPRRAALSSILSALNELQIYGLRSALVRFDVELHVLAFIEPAKARRLNGRDMDKHVLAAAFWRNESKTFRRVEEFDLTGRHYGFLLKA